MYNNIIHCAEASEKVMRGITNISGIAYSGGTIRQFWSQHPIVIDLSGMDTTKQTPLLYNHQNDPECRLGQVTAFNNGQNLKITGGVDTGTERGKFIAEAGKKFSWQLSVGAEITAAVMIPEEQNIEINGRTFTGPLIQVKRSVLREISVVAVGADQETSLQIAAAFKNQTERTNKMMTKEEINAVAEQFLAKQEAENNRSGLNIYTPSKTEVSAKSLEAALCFAAGIRPDIIAKGYTPQQVEAGEKMRGINLKRLMATCAGLEGKDTPITFDTSTIRAAFSTVSLPGILSNVANKKLLDAFTAQPIIATKLCRPGILNDFRPSERYRLTDVGDLELVIPGGELKHGGVMEDKAMNQLSTYGKIFVLTRQMIYNDDLGAFLRIPEAMGQRAARKIDQLFHARLLANPTFTDGKALFCADHGNYTTGTAGALTIDALHKARNKFLTAKDSDGQPICISPKYLLVPSCLDSIANEMIQSTTVTGGNTVIPAFNILSRYGLEVVSSPYLETGIGGQAGSTTGWYLFGDPAQIDTFEIGYLHGKTAPTVEQGEVNFNTLGLGFRVVFDLGIREQAYQGMTFNTGIAE